MRNMKILAPRRGQFCSRLWTGSFGALGFVFKSWTYSLHGGVYQHIGSAMLYRAYAWAWYFDLSIDISFYLKKQHKEQFRSLKSVEAVQYTAALTFSSTTEIHQAPIFLSHPSNALIFNWILSAPPLSNISSQPDTNSDTIRTIRYHQDHEINLFCQQRPQWAYLQNTSIRFLYVAFREVIPAYRPISCFSYKQFCDPVLRSL